MTNGPQYSDLWGAERPPALCMNCQEEMPMVYLSHRDDLGQEVVSMYLCTHCLTSLILASLESAGIASISLATDIAHLYARDSYRRHEWRARPHRNGQDT